MDLIISINKPKDITSQDAVTRLKRILKVKKAGHTGTLDPIATGLLIACTGKATRLASFFSSLDKEYVTVLKLGEATDTQDAYGKVTEKADTADIDSPTVTAAVESFQGALTQCPPMYSALKHKGQPLYKLARKGIEVERKSRDVFISSMEVLKVDLPYVTFRARCSKGTYMRTLCDDIGKQLGTFGHLVALERTAIGEFSLDRSMTFEELGDVDREQPAGRGIFTKDEALSWLPSLTVQESLLWSVKHGAPISALKFPDLSDNIKAAQGIRIKSGDNDLLAIGSYSTTQDVIKMDIVFA